MKLFKTQKPSETEKLSSFDKERKIHVAGDELLNHC